jgi:hypothetical protein
MKRLLIGLAASGLLSFANAQKTAEPPIPATWGAFQGSSQPADKKAVASVLKMEWWKVCETWGREARSGKNPRMKAATLAFLVEGNYVNGSDLNQVKNKTPEIGMTFCGVVAAMGMPDSVNQSKRASGHHNQMIYRSRHIYVYTDGKDANGLVTSIQF